MQKVTVCICTFRRAPLLRRLLTRLAEQKDEQHFALDAVIVDNDEHRSGWPVVEEAQAKNEFPVRYLHEPVRSISLARNLAVSNAQGDLIAFIDDDEYPGDGWLNSLVHCLESFEVDGVLGPVVPHFEETPPRWVVHGKFCERPTHEAGTPIGPRDMRTGNALLKRELFLEDDKPFDPKYGTIGGGDVDFFKRMVARGRKFVWSAQSVVFETVPPERLRRSYFVRRAFVRGLANAQKVRLWSMSTLKSVGAFIAYTLMLPFAFVAGQTIFMRLLISDCDHLGKLLGLLGLKPVKERPYESLRVSSTIVRAKPDDDKLKEDHS